MESLLISALLALLPAAAPQPALAKVVPLHPSLKFERAVQAIRIPDPAGERLGVLEQEGRLITFDPAKPEAGTSVLVEIKDRVRSPGDDGHTEQGLLGVALHPDFAKNRQLFLNYTRQPDGATVVSRFTLQTGKPPREDVLLTIEQPYANHNGGGIAFGPDGKLYIGTGDGGSGGDPKNNAQDGSSLLGKFLRIDVDAKPDPGLAYAIPKDNPFTAKGDDIRDEVWALGLRNPWRFSFDPKDGTLWVADVGQNKWEEVSIVRRGDNLGWRCYEGFHVYKLSRACKAKTLVPPVAEYGHDQGVSITGGVVYRGKALPKLEGGFLYGDYATGRIWVVHPQPEGKGKVQKVADSGLNISSFVAGADGEVIVVAYAIGSGAPLHKLVAP